MTLFQALPALGHLPVIDIIAEGWWIEKEGSRRTDLLECFPDMGRLALVKKAHVFCWEKLIHAATGLVQKLIAECNDHAG